MYYRESGDFKTSYQADNQFISVYQDKILVSIIIFLFWLVLPLSVSEFTFQAILIPFVIYSTAALGLNILTGYAGQISLGTGAFMGVGAYSCYKLVTYFPEVNIVIIVLLSGLFSSIIGVLFGLPSLKIKGFYLAIATLAAQFFLIWIFEKVAWLYNYNNSGAIEVPTTTSFNFVVTGPSASSITKYYIVLIICSLMTLITINLIRGRFGRVWQSVRDNDISSEIIGINILHAKISAFAISSYVIGVSGAMLVFFWKGAAEANLFDIGLSFRILFMVIIGGLGSVLGAFFGAFFIVVLPVLINVVPQFMGLAVASETVEHVNLIIIGSLIIAILIIEPHGLSRLWSIGREKLRLWPFPH